MRTKFDRQAGFVNGAGLELLLIILGIGLLSIVILGNWSARLFVCAVVGSFCAWAYWFDWSIRFRSGDCVLVKQGPRQGASGTVVEPLHCGRGARVLFDVGDHKEIVDFHAGYELQKLRGAKPA